MITTAESRVAERPARSHSPFHGRRRGRARYRGAFAAAVTALIGYAGVAVAGQFVPIPISEALEPAPERIALVMGNSDYSAVEDITDDPAGRRDAAAVGAALERLGFEVKFLEDAGYTDTLQGLMEFSWAAQSAETAVVFYSGHADEHYGRNFLIPVDVSLQAFREGTAAWIPVTWLMRSVKGASNLRLVVLDAYAPAPLYQVGEVIVALAAGVGTLPVREDDHVARGGSTPYTEALLRHLEEPGLELGMLFRKVRHDVMRTMEGQQEPAVYGLPGRPVFLGSVPDPTAEAPSR